MNIQTENAAKFDTQEACLAWIDERIVRFKLRMVKTHTETPGNYTYVPQKCEGSIVSTLNEGFKAQEFDEPLELYAAPTEQDGKWLAVMKVA